MHEQTIQKYAFNSDDSLGLQVSSLDFLWQKAEKSGRTHRASFYQFLWINRGLLSLTLDFQDVSLEAGQALLISPGQVVRFHLGERPEGFAALFVPEFLGDAPSDQSLLHRILSASLRGLRSTSLQGLPIAGLLGQLEAELTGPALPYREVIARSCLRILLAELGRRLTSEESTGSELARRFFDLVEEEHQRSYHVQDYLQRLGCTEKPLASAVRQAVGMTPKAYIDQRRLLEIKRYLVHSDLSVKEISFRLGFDEPTNFNKFFRKHTGFSPLEFRLSQG